jgi:hypothetical protein
MNKLIKQISIFLFFTSVSGCLLFERKEHVYDCSKVEPELMIKLFEECQNDKNAHASQASCHENARKSVCTPLQYM